MEKNDRLLAHIRKSDKETQALEDRLNRRDHLIDDSETRRIGHA